MSPNCILPKKICSNKVVANACHFQKQNSVNYSYFIKRKIEINIKISFDSDHYDFCCYSTENIPEK